MKHLLKIVDTKCVLGSQSEMMYKDGNTNEWFVGIKHEEITGKTYFIESNEKLGKDGYRHIVRFIGVVDESS
ncbi:hypothetical protein ACFLXP_06425 [Chloroflexota bacterium]